MRTSTDQYDSEGKLVNGFDYKNQCWVVNRRVIRCGHPESMDCGCYGKERTGLLTTATKDSNEGR